MEININDMVAVTLTSYGEQLLRQGNSASFRHNYNPLTMELKEQLWVVMNIFGEFFFNGSEQTFKNNRIVVCER